MPLKFAEMTECPACGARDWKRLYEIDRTAVWFCRCGMKFINPCLHPVSMMEIYQSSEALKQVNPALESYYEYDTSDPSTLTYRDYQRALDELVHIVSGREILEAGCGTGAFLEMAKTKGWTVFGVDSSFENISRLRKKGMDGKCADFLELQSNRKFDVVVLWDLIEHPKVPLLFFEKSRDLLKDGGCILIATPLYPNFLSLTAEFLYRLTGGKLAAPVRKMYFLEHTSYFSEKTLASLGERAGFRKVKRWKTETDLARYRFAPAVRFALEGAFFAARVLGLQNRIMMVLRKHE